MTLSWTTILTLIWIHWTLNMVFKLVCQLKHTHIHFLKKKNENCSYLFKENSLNDYNYESVNKVFYLMSEDGSGKSEIESQMLESNSINKPRKYLEKRNNILTSSKTPKKTTKSYKRNVKNTKSKNVKSKLALDKRPTIPRCSKKTINYSKQLWKHSKMCKGWPNKFSVCGMILDRLYPTCSLNIQKCIQSVLMLPPQCCGMLQCLNAKMYLLYVARQSV